MVNYHYKNRYDKFITTIKNSGRAVIGYSEVHHIQPKCLKGMNESSNLIELSLREHFLAHWLLWKAYPDYLPLASAFLQMNNKNPRIEQKGFQGRITSKTYMKLKTEVYETLSAFNTDKVYVKDENGVSICLSRNEFSSSVYDFHTRGKVYVLNLDTEEWEYITSEKYKTSTIYKSYVACLNDEILSEKFNLPSHNKIYIDRLLNEEVSMPRMEAKKLNAEYEVSIQHDKLKKIKKRYIEKINHKTTIIINGEKKSILSSEYDSSTQIHNNKNKISVFDTTDSKRKKISSEEYYLNPNRYITSSKGKVLAFDTIDNKFMLIDKEKFDNVRYVGQTKNLTTVLNKETNLYEQISVEEFRRNKSKYHGPNFGKITVIDKDLGERSSIEKSKFNKTQYISLGDKSHYFQCKHLLTNKLKNVSIYEWHIVHELYEILDWPKFHTLLNLI
jgi:hypothetical protein